MTTKDVKRKLRAILSADVQGYSRLMGDDEVATVKTITEYRETLTSLVNQYNGRVVDSPGDNILAEFGSVVDAVQCAVEIQNILKAKNEDLPENRRMIFRIGVNLGDVIQEGDRIYGDGVNIAARIESLADGGGICISGTAYDQIENKLALGYNFIGEHSVKNIAKPVRVYKVPMDPKDVGKKRGGEKAKRSRLKWLSAGFLSFIIIIGIVLGGMYWKYLYLPTPKDIDPENKLVFDLSKGPSVAVLPFVNMSEDPKLEVFCDGITENIISALSHIRQLFVIARNSTFFYKGKQINVKQIGHDLGADYIIEGSVQKSGELIRLTVQLIDTKTGYHEWSEIYDRSLKNFFTLQDEITVEILKAIGIKLSEGELIRVKFGRITNLQILIKALEAWKTFHKMNPEDNDLARRKLLEIVDSGYQDPFIYSLLGFTYVLDLFWGTCEPKIVCFGKATEAARKALSLDENSSKAHELAGYLFVMRKEAKKGINEFKRVITINPNNADAICNLGWALGSDDRHHEGIEYIRKAIMLNPRPPSFYYLVLGYAYRGIGEYEKSIVELKKSLEIEPKNIMALIGLAAAYALLGREKEAREAASEVLKINPDFSGEEYVKSLPIKDKTKKENLAEGLRKAGLN